MARLDDDRRRAPHEVARDLDRMGPLGQRVQKRDEAVRHGQTVGKTKTIDHGGGRFIVPAPGQKATLTANGKTVKYVVTGTFTWTCQMVNRHDAGHRLSANKYVLRENRRNFLSAPRPETGDLRRAC